MATRTTPEAPAEYHSPFGQEQAPSALRADEPSAARLAGLVGVCCVVAGVLIILLNWMMGPRVMSPSASTWFFIAGVAGLLFHAARDADVQIRRTYGALGGALALLGVGVAFVQYEGQIGVPFLAVSVPAFLLGLFFLLPFTRHEDDPTWRRNARTHRPAPRRTPGRCFPRLR